MDNQDKQDIKELLKLALEERSSEYTNKKRFKIIRKDYKDFFSNKITIIFIPFIILTYIIIFFLSEATTTANNNKIKEHLTAAKKELLFSNLPKNIQSNYILKSIQEELQVSISKNEEKIKKLSQLLVKANNKIKNKEAEENRLLINNKESTNKITLNKKIAYLQQDLLKTKDKIKKQKYKSITCATTPIGLKSMPRECIVKFRKFLKANAKTTVRFQIIPLMDKSDEKFIQANSSKKTKELLKFGISRSRVLEAAWLVKDTLGKEALISYVSYIAQSKTKRGIIIRAYK